MSLRGIYGGLETIRSYLPKLNSFISKTLNLERQSKLSLSAFFIAVKIALDEISMPIPFDKSNSFSIES